jgi:hypothetical protein
MPISVQQQVLRAALDLAYSELKRMSIFRPLRSHLEFIDIAVRVERHTRVQVLELPDGLSIETPMAHVHWVSTEHRGRYRSEMRHSGASSETQVWVTAGGRLLLWQAGYRHFWRAHQKVRVEHARRSCLRWLEGDTLAELVAAHPSVTAYIVWGLRGLAERHQDELRQNLERATQTAENVASISHRLRL